MPYERYTSLYPSSLGELEERETKRVLTNAFIQDIDRELYDITETPPHLDESDELLCLCSSLAREHRLQELCYRVEDLIAANSHLARIDIDNPEGVPGDPLGPANCLDEKERMEAINRGKREATEDLMRILAPDTGLLRALSPIDAFSQMVLDMYTNPWKKELLQRADLEPFSEFTDGVKYYQGGIITLTLKTRLPTIDYSLVYPPGKQFPSRYLYAVDKAQNF